MVVLDGLRERLQVISNQICLSGFLMSGHSSFSVSSQPTGMCQSTDPYWRQFLTPYLFTSPYKDSSLSVVISMRFVIETYKDNIPVSVTLSVPIFAEYILRGFPLWTWLHWYLLGNLRLPLNCYFAIGNDEVDSLVGSLFDKYLRMLNDTDIDPRGSK